MPLVSPTPIKLLVPRAMSEKLSAKVVYSGPVAAPVQKGQRIGTLKVSRGDNVVLEVPLQAGEDVGSGSLHQRAFDAAGRDGHQRVPRRYGSALTSQANGRKIHHI